MTKLFWFSFLKLVQLRFFLQPPQKRLLDYFKKIKDGVMVQASHTPHGVEGAHDFLGNSANTDSICQAKGEPGKPRYPLLPLKQTNKQKLMEYK